MAVNPVITYRKAARRVPAKIGAVGTEPMCQIENAVDKREIVVINRATGKEMKSKNCFSVTGSC